MPKYIYWVGRTDMIDYDEYDSIVVIASSKDEAKTFGPYNKPLADPENLQVEKVGVVTSDLDLKYKIGDVILSSYNAG